MIGKIPPSASEEEGEDRRTKEVRNEKRLLSTEAIQCNSVFFLRQLQVAYFFAVCFLEGAKKVKEGAKIN